METLIETHARAFSRLISDGISGVSSLNNTSNYPSQYYKLGIKFLRIIDTTSIN